MTGPVLSMHGVVKSFGRQTALDGVDFAVRAGEVVALLGENGAGKSTLMNVATGILAPTAGEIRIEGRAVSWSSARDARASGISMVHQHFMLVPSLTVAENLALAEGIRGSFRRERIERHARELSARLGLEIGDPARPIDDLAVGEQQRVEILKALASPTRVLILDEPTAVLTPAEVDELFAIVRRLAADGTGIVLVTHKLGEVHDIADRVAILRRGRMVADGPLAGYAPGEIASRMVGEANDGATGAGSGEAETTWTATAPMPAPALAQAPASGLARAQSPTPPSVAVRLSARGLTVRDRRGVLLLDGVSLEVRAGEILAVAGVEGNGQAEMVAALSLSLGAAAPGGVGPGARLAPGSEVRIDGRLLRTTAEARLAGLAVVPGDRHRDGLVLELEVWENLLLGVDLARAQAPRGWIDRAAAIESGRRLVEQLRVHPADPHLPAAALSGGNQQRVILARELVGRRPSVVIAASPTRGLDLAATARIQEMLRELASAGAAVLVVSTDLDEVLSLGDRIGVLYRGRLLLPAPGEASRAEVGRLMAGGSGGRGGGEVGRDGRGPGAGGAGTGGVGGAAAAAAGAGEAAAGATTRLVPGAGA